jgi:hypothetical protein
MHDTAVALARTLDEYFYVVGPIASVAIFGSFAFCALVADTKHARAQEPPIRAVPFMPQHHWRQMGYIFSGRTWREVGPGAKALLLVTRLLLCIAVLGIASMFAAGVITDLNRAEVAAPMPASPPSGR